MRRGEARRGEKRNEPRCGAERSGAERSGSACLDRDVATVWPSYALLPLLLSFSEPHFSLLHCLSVCLSRSVSLYTTTTVATVATLRGSQKAMSRSLLCRCTTSREFVIYEERQAPDERKFQPSFPSSLLSVPLSLSLSSALPFAVHCALTSWAESIRIFPRE